MATKQLTVTAEEIQAWKTGKQDTIVSGTNATGTGNVVLATSPTLTGTPIVPTASVGTNTTQAANTAYVKAEIVATTPATVDISTVLTNTALTGVPTAPTAAIGTSTTQVANTTFVYDNSYDVLADFKLLSSTIKSVPLGFTLHSASSGVTLTDGSVYFTMLHTMPESTSITGLKMVCSASASYTEDNFNGAALYSFNGTTFTQVAISANSATPFKSGTSSVATIPFTSPFTTAANTIYVAAVLTNSSAVVTAPALYFNVSLHPSLLGMFFDSSHRPFYQLAAQTALPSSVATNTLSSSLYSCVLIFPY